MRLHMVTVAIILVGLSATADNSSLVLNIERTVNSLNRKVNEVSRQVDEVSTHIGSILSNHFADITCEYESRLKEQLGKIDEEIGDAVKDKEFYSKRYAELERLHEQFVGRMQFWLTLVCLVVTVLGVVLPLASMILQRKSFEREAEIVKKAILIEVNEARKSMETRFLAVQKDSLCGLDLVLSHSIEQFDLMLPDMKPEDGLTKVVFLLMPIIFGFHQLMECAMRTQDERVVKDKISEYRRFIDSWQNPEIPQRAGVWKCIVEGIRESVIKDRGSMMRCDYARVLGEGSDSFKWLEKFYKDFAEWKFA